PELSSSRPGARSWVRRTGTAATDGARAAVRNAGASARRPWLPDSRVWIFLSARSSLLHVLHVEHEPPEFLLDEPDLPGLVGLAEVLQVVVAVDVDDVVFLVTGVVAL